MIQLTVTRTETVTPVIRRVWFRSDDLSAFAESGWTDRYVKLQFPDAVRTYTALYPDTEAGTLAIDFVTHGDVGVAGPWAQAARPGDRLLVNGPGGAYRPEQFLHRAGLAPGDGLESAVRRLDWLPGRVHAFVHGEASEVMHGLRPYLLRELGLERDQVSISGYWRRGRTEEGFRQWKSELATAEAAKT